MSRCKSWELIVKQEKCHCENVECSSFHHKRFKSILYIYIHKYIYFFSHQKVQPSKPKRRIPCHNLWVSWFHNIYIHLQCIWQVFVTHHILFEFEVKKKHVSYCQDLFRKCCWWSLKIPGACWSKWLQIYCNFCPSWFLLPQILDAWKVTTSWKKKKPNQPNQTGVEKSKQPNLTPTQPNSNATKLNAMMSRAFSVRPCTRAGVTCDETKATWNTEN